MIGSRTPSQDPVDAVERPGSSGRRRRRRAAAGPVVAGAGRRRLAGEHAGEPVGQVLERVRRRGRRASAVAGVGHAARAARRRRRRAAPGRPRSPSCRRSPLAGAVARAVLVAGPLRRGRPAARRAGRSCSAASGRRDRGRSACRRRSGTAAPPRRRSGRACWPRRSARRGRRTGSCGSSAASWSMLLDGEVAQLGDRGLAAGVGVVGEQQVGAGGGLVGEGARGCRRSARRRRGRRPGSARSTSSSRLDGVGELGAALARLADGEAGVGVLDGPLDRVERLAGQRGLGGDGDRGRGADDREAADDGGDPALAASVRRAGSWSLATSVGTSAVSASAISRSRRSATNSGAAAGRGRRAERADELEELGVARVGVAALTARRSRTARPARVELVGAPLRPEPPCHVDAQRRREAAELRRIGGRRQTISGEPRASVPDPFRHQLGEVAHPAQLELLDGAVAAARGRPRSRRCSCPGGTASPGSRAARRAAR